jgi:hypothetical protein
LSAKTDSLATLTECRTSSVLIDWRESVQLMSLLARHRYIISRFAETFIRDEIEIEQMMLSLAHCPLSLIENISSSLLMD